MGFLARCFPRVTYCVNVWMLLMFYCYLCCYIDDQRRGSYVLCMYSTIVHDQDNLCLICVKLFKISTCPSLWCHRIVFSRETTRFSALLSGTIEMLHSSIILLLRRFYNVPVWILCINTYAPNAPWTIL